MNSDLRLATAARQAGLIDALQLASACAARDADDSTSMAVLLVERGWVDKQRVDQLIHDLLNEPGTLDECVSGTMAAAATVQAAAPACSAPAELAPTLAGEAPTQKATASDALGNAQTLAATVSAPNRPVDGSPAADSLPPTIAATIDHVLNDRDGQGPRTGTEETVADTLGGRKDPGGAETIATPAAVRRHELLKAVASQEATRDRYTLTRLHAKGGIGQVWLARDTSLGREVALKELRPDGHASFATWNRFLAEAKITGQLEHPGIVPVYELKGEGDDQQPFYTMRFIRGHTLCEAIAAYHEKRKRGEAGPLERAALLNAFVDACNAVAYAHSRGVIHRDLKGQNIVLGDFGEVMVLDWGLAKVLGRDESADASQSDSAAIDLDGAAHFATRQGQVQGTPAYMAPEQAEGRIDEIEQRTDVYGLGAILYELLAGKPPFTGSDTRDVLRRVCEEPPARPREADPKVPQALEAICLHAMAKAPEDRYPTAMHLAEDVRRWLADEPVSVYREPLGVRVNRWAKRNRAAVNSIAAVVLIGIISLSVTAFVVSRERDEARRQRQQARRAVDDMYTQVADQWLEDRLDPLQRSFLEKALSYYESFTSEDARDPAVRQEHGRAYLRKGDVLKKLGRHQEAEASYGRAIDVLSALSNERPPVRENRLHLATAHNHLAGSYVAAGGRFPDAVKHYKQALDLQQALVKEAPSSTYRIALAKTEKGLSDLHRLTGRPDEAEADVRQAVELLEPVVAESPKAVEPRQDLAAALDGLGLLLRERSRPREAEEAFRRARDLLEKLVADSPTMPQLRDGLAKVYNSLGLLVREQGTAEEAETILRRQVAQEERLADDFPDRPDYRRALSRSLLNLAVVLKENGRPKEAEPAYRRAQALNEVLAKDFPTVLIYRREQARCLANLGELMATSGKRKDAEAFYRKALAIYEKLAQEAPSVADYSNAIGLTRINLGELLDGNGAPPEAEAEYQKALDQFSALVAKYPENPDYQRGQATCLLNMAGIMVASGRNKQADVVYQKAATIFDGLLSRTPDNAAAKLALADCLSSQGENRRQGHLDGAGEILKRSVDLYAQVVKESPNQPDYRRGLAVGQVNYGEWLSESGKKTEADAAFKESLALLEKLTAEAPSAAPYQFYLGYVLGDLAKERIAAKQPEEARPYWERALVADRAALAADPKNPTFREGLRGHLVAQAETLIALGNHRDASRTVEESLRAGNDLAGTRSEAARVLARCAAVAGADASLPETVRAIASGGYADRAIALLREALEKGEPGIDQLAQQAAFDPLRGRESYKTLPFAATEDKKDSRVVD